MAEPSEMADSSKFDEKLQLDEKTEPEVLQRVTKSLENLQTSTRDKQNANPLEAKINITENPCDITRSGRVLDSCQSSDEQASTLDTQNVDSLQQKEDTEENYEKSFDVTDSKKVLDSLKTCVTCESSNSDEKLKSEISKTMATTLETSQASTLDTQNADSLEQKEDTEENHEKHLSTSNITTNSLEPQKIDDFIKLDEKGFP